AIPRLKAVIAKDKTFWRAYRTLAESYAQKQQYNRADEYFRTLLAEDPQNGLAYYGLGETSAKKKEWRAAVGHFQVCNGLDPKTHICAMRAFETAWSANLPATIPWDPDNLYLYPAKVARLGSQLDYASQREVARRGLEMARAQR